MSITIYIALLAWPVVALVLFTWLPARRAAIAAYLGAWMFLPQKSPFVFESLPEYDKAAASAMGVLLGTLIFSPGTFLRFKPTWFDLPMLLWLAAPMFSAIANDVGHGSVMKSAYGGMTMIVTQTMVWGIPYYMGRCYLRDFAGLRELATCIFMAGLIYAPLCLLEVRLAPRLHLWVYGSHAHSFVQTIRLGGFRPTVFMQHGLMVGLFMCSATVVGFWLWLSGTVKSMWSMPMSWLVGFMIVTSLLCKSAGAIVLMTMAIGALLMLYYLNTRVAVIAMILIAPTYVVTRSAGLWTGEQLVTIAEDVFGAERAGSIEGRMSNEDRFTERAEERPIFGWSGWNRFQVVDEWGKLQTTPDGMWVIARGQFGFVGLVALGSFLLTPAILLSTRFGERLWLRPEFGPTVALTMITLMFTIDSLLNAMISPMYVLAAGGLIAVLPHARIAGKKQARPSQARATRSLAHS
ncbi:MAG: O-antigen ligase domain-containing protein [Phycisphaerales bacterium JB063]